MAWHVPLADEWLDRRMVSCLGIQLAAAWRHRWPSGIFTKIFCSTIFHWKIFLESGKLVTGQRNEEMSIDSPERKAQKVANRNIHDNILYDIP